MLQPDCSCFPGCQPLIVLPPPQLAGRRGGAEGEFLAIIPEGQAPVNPSSVIQWNATTVPPTGGVRLEVDGIHVPRGVYLVSWTLNPVAGSQVSLQVNGTIPSSAATGYQYGTTIVESSNQDVVFPIQREFLIQAPLADNLINLRNTGNDTFNLRALPNSRQTIGGTEYRLGAQIRVLRQLGVSTT